MPSCHQGGNRLRQGNGHSGPLRMSTEPATARDVTSQQLTYEHVASRLVQEGEGEGRGKGVICTPGPVLPNTQGACPKTEDLLLRNRGVGVTFRMCRRLNNLTCSPPPRSCVVPMTCPMASPLHRSGTP